MKEIIGDLWDYEKKDPYRICITTNGSIKNNGELVMGRGCALEAKEKWPELPLLLGQSVKHNGNVLNLIYLRSTYLVSFPVKHKWNKLADINLITKSAHELYFLSQLHKHLIFILPKPGCGNGGLNWDDVKQKISFLPDNVSIIDRY